MAGPASYLDQIYMDRGDRSTHNSEVVAKNDQLSSLKFKNSEQTQNQKIISLSYLQEIQTRENQIDLYRNQVGQLQENNNQLMSKMS